MRNRILARYLSCTVLAFMGALSVPVVAAPATPSSVSVTRADGQLIASWPDVSGATSYHVTYSANSGASWSLAALNHPSSSITIDGVDNTKTYIVGVRARSSAGDSGWRNSPAAGPYENTPQVTPPSTPSSVSVTRADGQLSASWSDVSGATSYHVTYTVESSGSWSLAALNHPSSSITIDGVDNTKSYIVGVRARNSAGDSGWRNSPVAGPYSIPVTPPAAPSSVSVTRTDGQLTASWSDVSDATSYHVTYTSDSGASWSLAALNHPSSSITISSVDNSKSYIVGVRSRNSGGDSGWRNSPSAGPYSPATITATDVTSNSATIELDNYDGAWYYVASDGSDTQGASVASTNCNGPVNGKTAELDGLESGTQYTINAYSNCGGAAIASSQFNTASVDIIVAVSDIRARSARLTLEYINPLSNAWYYKRVDSNPSDPDNTCHRLDVDQTVVNLSGLQLYTTYTYGVYVYAGCNIAQDTLVFRTTSSSATDVGATTVTLNFQGGGGNDSPNHWYYAETGISYVPPTGQPFPSNCHYGGASTATNSASVIVRDLEPNNGDSESSYTFKAYFTDDCEPGTDLATVNVNTLDPVLRLTSSNNNLQLSVNNWGTNDPALYYRTNIADPKQNQDDWDGPVGCTAFTSGTTTTVSSRPSLPNSSAYYVYGAYYSSDCHVSKVVAYVKHSSPISSNSSVGSSSNWMSPDSGGMDAGDTWLDDVSDETRRESASRGTSASSGGVAGNVRSVGLDAAIGDRSSFARENALDTSGAAVTTFVDGNSLLLPLFLSASDPGMRRSVVHIVNRSDYEGTVHIEAYDDSSWIYEPLTLDIDAGASIKFDSYDLEFGNPVIGLAAGTGSALSGHWQMKLSSSLDIEAVTYILHSDGFVTSMSDVAPVRGGIHRVAIFNEASSFGPRSLLRIVNPGEREAKVTIRGIDSDDQFTNSTATLTVQSNSSETLTAQQLESGTENLEGALGKGTSAWRLHVGSDEPILVMSLSENANGYLSNLSQ